MSEHDPFRDLATSLWYAARTLSRESAVDSLAQALHQAAEGATRAERVRCACLMEDWVGEAFGERGEEAAAVIRGEPHAP
jgi:aromatic ring hydroxylase